MGLMNQAPTRIRFVRATHRGMQLGEAHLRFLLIPYEWGMKGVE